MPIISLASLPNSRIKPRNATRQAKTNQVVVPANQVFMAIPENINRTYLFIFNTNNQASLKYGYGDQIGDIQFTLGPDRGIDLESLGAIYVYSDTELTLEYDEGEA